MTDATSSANLIVDRNELLAKCAVEVQEWTQLDAWALAQFVLSPVGRKFLGILQLTQKELEGGLMAVKLDGDVLGNLGKAQGRVLGFSTAIDEILNLCEPKEAVDADPQPS